MTRAPLAALAALAGVAAVACLVAGCGDEARKRDRDLEALTAERRKGPQS